MYPTCFEAYKAGCLTSIKHLAWAGYVPEKCFSCCYRIKS